tara:strand:+ start:676 stop:855 length:180 start_codon:yes stop_codon:yes gene_type:complete
MKRFLYKNRNIVFGLALLLIISGAYLGYIFYGTEPQETIGGFLCGIGFGILLIYFSIKN